MDSDELARSRPRCVAAEALTGLGTVGEDAVKPSLRPAVGRSQFAFRNDRDRLQGTRGLSSLAIAILITAAGCRASPPHRRALPPVIVVPDTDIDIAPAPAPAPPPTAPPQVEAADQVPVPDAPRRGQIARAALLTVLDRGPGAFLQTAILRPQFRRRRFVGWEIVKLAPDAFPRSRVDVRAGDIIGPVNGRLIVRPGHLYELWSELRVAAAIEVRVERAGQPFDLRFEIIDEPSSSPRDIVPP